MIRNQSSIALPREQWDTWDPMLISEGLFAAANIFRLVSHSIFSRHMELWIHFTRKYSCFVHSILVMELCMWERERGRKVMVQHATPSLYTVRLSVVFSSSLKLVYIFSVNPYLGPLQVSLSRMVTDIMKFLFLYVLVLFAFSCGTCT